jgi:hypothetical protein
LKDEGEMREFQVCGRVWRFYGEGEIENIGNDRRKLEDKMKVY